MTLTPIKELVREHCGLSFEDGREAMLAAGVKERQLKRGLGSPGEYLDLLCREPAEVRKLVSLVTVSETYFFREAAHFRLLVERLLPELAAARGGNRGAIKIVSAGCSTGEELYTLAIALRERFGPGFGAKFRLIGFDIDEESLARARDGVYAAHSFRGVPDRIRADYFEAAGERYRINTSCRDAVTFLRQSVCADSYDEALHAADVIFYRNVSIYFEPEAQQRIFRGLAGLLRERGYLFLSSTETFCHNIGVLSLVERDGIFLYTKGVEVGIEERRKEPARAETPRAARAGAAPRPAPAPPAVIPRSQAEPHRIFDEALRLAETKAYAPALERLERVIALEPSFTAALLLKTQILVNCKRFAEAEAAGSQIVARDRWCLEGQLFLGLIAKIQGALAAAKARFKEAVYVQPSCWIAHFYLGEIYRCEGDLDRAGREFNVVIGLLEGQSAATHGLKFFAFSFSSEQIVHLCRHNLAAMKA